MPWVAQPQVSGPGPALTTGRRWGAWSREGSGPPRRAASSSFPFSLASTLAGVEPERTYCDLPGSPSLDPELRKPVLGLGEENPTLLACVTRTTLQPEMWAGGPMAFSDELFGPLGAVRGSALAF